MEQICRLASLAPREAAPLADLAAQKPMWAMRAYGWAWRRAPGLPALHAAAAPHEPQCCPPLARAQRQRPPLGTGPAAQPALPAGLLAARPAAGTRAAQPSPPQRWPGPPRQSHAQGSRLAGWLPRARHRQLQAHVTVATEHPMRGQRLWRRRVLAGCARRRGSPARLGQRGMLAAVECQAPGVAAKRWSRKGLARHIGAAAMWVGRGGPERRPGEAVRLCAAGVPARRAAAAPHAKPLARAALPRQSQLLAAAQRWLWAGGCAWG
jgi:hypothetical protein